MVRRHDRRNIHNLTASILLAGVIFAIGTFVLCMYSTGGYGTTFSWRPLMTCWLLLLATVSTALQIEWTLLAFVTKQQDVSPSVFIETDINNRVYVMLYVLWVSWLGLPWWRSVLTAPEPFRYVIINWSADGLLVGKCVPCVWGRPIDL